MIDCGEGAQLAMQRQRLSFAQLTDIFISHLHGDHCLGLPGLISTMALHQRGGTVTVHTFAEGARHLADSINFFCRERPFDLRFNIIDPERPGLIADLGGLTVEGIPLQHRVPTVGFLLREKPKPRHLRGDMAEFYQVPTYMRAAIKGGADFTCADGRVIPNAWLTTDATPSRSYAYCSDTLYFPELAQAVKGVDLLYHEATYADDCAAKARQRHHSTASQAAMTARDAGAGRLLLGHFSKAYADEARHLAEASAIFPRTIIASEGMSLEI